MNVEVCCCVLLWSYLHLGRDHFPDTTPATALVFSITSPSVISTMTVVSSAECIMGSLVWEVTQSYVKRAQSIGFSTLPGGIHMLTVAHVCLTGFRLWYGCMWWIRLSSSGSFGAGYALDSVPVCHRAHKETYSFMLAVIHTWQNLDSPANLTCISLGCGGSRGAQRDPTQTRPAPAGRGIWPVLL